MPWVLVMNNIVSLVRGKNEGSSTEKEGKKVKCRLINPEPNISYIFMGTGKAALIAWLVTYLLE